MQRNFIRRNLLASTIFLTTGLGGGVALPAYAQDTGATSMADIVVTARRREELLQDVPISMVVLGQEQLANANVVNASDLASTVPGLVANERFGGDNTSFTIRGFTQELRTTPSVGVYFADVVAPRGATPVTSGDGAGPGAFFDLANVQILKGPQGTLFGRNTTGGAILLVPQKPKSEFEGKIEGSIGSFNLRRVQAIVNIPVNDNIRLRFGVDDNQRDGFLNNISEKGPRDPGSVNYTAVRASLVIDITPNLENYTIGSYTDSNNNASYSQFFACNPRGGSLPTIVGQMCNASLPTHGRYHDVQNSLPDTSSKMRQWQVINTTTWQASDNLTFRNIISFANLKSTLISPVIGTDWDPNDIRTTANLGGGSFPWAAVGGQAPGATPHNFIPQMSGVMPGVPTVAQDSFVEEFQVRGTHFNDKLTWQAGFYYEKSTPSQTQVNQAIANLTCDLSSLDNVSPAAFRCADTNYIAMRASGLPQPTAFAISRGAVNRSLGGTSFQNTALYFQGTYDLVDKLSLTLGGRYTWDKTTGRMQNINYYFNPGIPGFVPDGINFGDASTATTLVAPTFIACADPSLRYAGNPDNCNINPRQSSKAPTWLIGLDYTPIDDVLVYAKYTRGYRQGGVNIASVRGGYTFEAEKVDTWEIGTKTSFGGPFPGVFNISGFYNKLSDQQVQQGILPQGSSGTTAIVNVGASTIYGLEALLSARLFQGFTASASYSYLHSRFDKVDDPITFDPTCGGGLGGPSFNGTCILGGTTAAIVGQPTTFSPKHQLQLTGTYRLPTPEELGQWTISASYNYSHGYLAVMPNNSPYAWIPSFDTVNFNMSWENIFQTNFSARAFITNLFDKNHYSYIAGQYNSTGFEYRALAQPFTGGFSLSYNF